MQTILGAGGPIGTELAKALSTHTDRIRLVSRNPERVNPNDELHSADLLHPEKVAEALKGASIAYLTAGLPYRLPVWEEQWPKLMRNVVDACKTENCKLVFFDNIYMYDENQLAPMTEATEVNPPSKKGKVRARLVEMILEEVRAGRLTALIARSADFYGPSIQNTSVLTEMVINNLAQGKKGDWLDSLDFKHSFTYTPDAGKATALLGNTPDAYGQVWHLPTAPNPLTGREWIEAFAKELGVSPKSRLAPKWLVRVMGLFNPIMKELVEMMYQYDRDYVFDSTKFEERFKISPTPYAEGIKTIVATDYR